MPLVSMRRFSPRKWGLLPPRCTPAVGMILFPTQVGVTLQRKARYWYSGSFPHASGGYSFWYNRNAQHPDFSPRKWGLLSSPRFTTGGLALFPTQVGVTPVGDGTDNAYAPFPHTSWGISNVKRVFLSFVCFSPREWGYLLG